MGSQRGSAIVMLFIAAALFGVLAYAFLQGSRGSTGFMMDEASKAKAVASQGQVNVVNMAVRRLKMRGCSDAQISFETPAGYNTNPSAPADKHCHVYRVEGGGVRFADPDVAPADPCTTAALGAACTTDGAIYAGTVGGNRFYVETSNSLSMSKWKTTNTDTPGATSYTDGLANTNDIQTAGLAAHPPAQACRSKPGGQWYLPARDELYALYDNRASLPAANIPTSGYYWGSADVTSTDYADILNFSDRTWSVGNKALTGVSTRCVRR